MVWAYCVAISRCATIRAMPSTCRLYSVEGACRSMIADVGVAWLASSQKQRNAQLKSTQSNSTQHNAKQRKAKQRNAKHSNAKQNTAKQSNTKQSKAKQNKAKHCSAIVRMMRGPVFCQQQALATPPSALPTPKPPQLPTGPTRPQPPSPRVPDAPPPRLPPSLPDSPLPDP